MVDRNYAGFPKKINEASLQSYISRESERIVNTVISSGGDYFAYDVKEKLARFLGIKEESVEEVDEQKIQAFITLQIKLVDWAQRHNLEKDWIIKYAYEFLRLLSDDSNLKPSEIQVGRLMDFSLVAHPFEFKFDGWFPGNEDLEDYTDRLRENFESELDRYFRIVGSNLDLEKKKHLTKPIDFDRVKWLVRWTVQRWSKEQILEESDEEFQNKGIEKYITIRTIEIAFQQFKNYDLPVR